ncbi:MAG: UPF0175 family protein [Bacteroidota bacterium]|nr:UPF0175 family protein [Bacteroidota bacterium]
MKTITLNIPDSVNLEEHEVVMIVASKLYEQGKLLVGQAAAIAGLHKRAFAESLAKYGVSIFNYPPSDLPRDIKNA